jgi:hypothetical protein
MGMSPTESVNDLHELFEIVSTPRDHAIIVV